ncbi:MAG: YidB family protein [Verrucomicrobia bacterium]|nr:YidB family protein [Verrucomicrobiota bacterium]
MSLIGDLAKKALGGLLGGEQGGTQASLAAMLPAAAGLIQQVGGIDGLVAKFNAAGLGDKISGWISTGPNPPATAEDIKAALGSHLAEVAQATGQDAHGAANGLAALLPGLIDKLTPTGVAPKGDALSTGLQSLLSGGLGKIFG